MADKKQGFIKTYFGKPYQLLKEIGSSVPKIAPFVRNRKGDLDNWSETARERLKNPALSNFDLGTRFFNEKNFKDAVTRFKIACFMKKDYAESYFMLGRSYLALGKVNKAVSNFDKAATYKCDHKEFEYFSKIYLKDEFTVYPSDNLKKEYFSHLSSVFDEYYIDSFNYQGIVKSFDIFDNHNEKQNPKILELGCGVGKLGNTIKDSYHDASITGVDSNADMVNYAKELECPIKEKETVVIDLKQKNKPEENHSHISVYDYLIKTDFNNFDDFSKKYDVVIARGFFHYIDEYKKVIGNISKLLNKGGLFIHYARNPLEKEDYQIIRNDFSFPFYNNFRFQDEKAFTAECKKKSLKLLAKQEFTLEIKYPATIFVYKKS